MVTLNVAHACHPTNAIVATRRHWWPRAATSGTQHKIQNEQMGRRLRHRGVCFDCFADQAECFIEFGAEQVADQQVGDVALAMGML